MIVLFCLVFAVTGYCHGMQYLIPTLPTIVNRLCSAIIVTCATLLAMPNYTWWTAFYLFAGFLLWIWPGEMSQFTDAIGNNPKVARWKGLIEVTVREALALPLLAGLCFMEHHSYWPLVGVAFMGLPYYMGGYVLTGNLRRFVIVVPHAVKWTIIGGMIWWAMQ